MHRLILLALFLLPACQPVTDSSDALTVGKDRSGAEVSLNPGQELRIRLESNITTGYRWTVLEGDESILAQQGDPEYITPDQDRQRTGAGGVEVFHFKPVKPGRAHLRLAYLRPWENDAPPAETFALVVIVQ